MKIPTERKFSSIFASDGPGSAGLITSNYLHHNQPVHHGAAGWLSL